MRPGKIALNIQIREDLIPAIERYQHRQMFRTKTAAVEFLLESALALNPERKLELKKLLKPRKVSAH